MWDVKQKKKKEARNVETGTCDWIELGTREKCSGVTTDMAGETGENRDSYGSCGVSREEITTRDGQETISEYTSREKSDKIRSGQRKDIVYYYPLRQNKRNEEKYEILLLLL